MSTLGTISGQVRLDIRPAVASYAALRAQNARTTYALRGTGDSFVAAGQRMAVAGGVMVYGFAKVVNAAAEFERKMDFASAVSGTTGEKMQQLSDYALQLGQDTIYSAGQIAEGFIELAKAGVSAEQIIGGIGVAMTNLGAAGDIPLMQSGQIITSTIQQFDLAARDAVKVTDLLAGAANASIADISDIGVSLKYVGGVASAVGLTFEDTTTAISLLAKAGIRGSTAGTSLRQMLVSLGGATEPAREALSELGIITEDGTNKFFTAEGKAKSLSQVFQILKDSTADLTQKQRLMYLRTIFNNRALSAASILTRDGAKGFKEMNKEMSKTTAAAVASERLDNLSGDIEILRGNIETMMIQAGSPFQKTLRGWVQGLTKLIQVFGDLDPKTQETIVKTVAMTGAALVAMGAFNIIVGTIFRFAASMLKLGAAMKFAGNILKIVIVNARWAAVLFGGPLLTAIAGLTAPVWLTIAAIAALGAGFVVAYKKSATFRNVIATIAGVIKRGVEAFGSWLKLLATDPSAAWDQLKAAAQIAVAYVIAQFRKLPGLIEAGLKAAGDKVLAFRDRVVLFLQSLPGMAAAALASFVASVVSFFAQLPARVGYFIGFMAGTVVRLLLTMGINALNALLTFGINMMTFFASLSARVGYFIGFMAGRVIGAMIRMGIRMVQLAGRMIGATIAFFQKLPGRVVAFVLSTVNQGIAAFNRFRTQAPQIAAQLIAGVVNFFRTLPGKVVNFVTNTATQARAKFSQMKTQAIEMASQLVAGFSNGLQGLPGLTAGIVGKAIAAFKSMVSSAFNAAKDFAAGLWNGFKDGLGINSPSLIEKQMVQMTGVMDKETKRMAKQTLQVQAISKRLAKTTFAVGDPLATSSAAKYKQLASMQLRNQNRSRTLADHSGKRGDRARPIVKVQKGPQRIAGALSLDPSGYAFIAGVAEDVFDGYSDDNTRRGGS